jgi:hypothetical protein
MGQKAAKMAEEPVDMADVIPLAVEIQLCGVEITSSPR